MELIERITERTNMNKAFERVLENKGAAGIDGISINDLKEYLTENSKEIVRQMRNKEYKPQPVRRVFIPKNDGTKRPLGIPIVVDRVVQQAIAQVLSEVYEPKFSNFSFGFRPNRSCHTAINKTLEFLNDGHEWVVDIDIEKFFDQVNHDKLITILREYVNDAPTLNLIRKFLRAGIMEKGLVTPSDIGMPQGGNLSPILSNIILDKLDKELESRGLNFTRYADDCLIFVKSELAANRVMKSVTNFIEKKLFLKVNATKSKIIRPTKTNYLGFTFRKDKDKWKVAPSMLSRKKLKCNIKQVLCRRRASAMPLAITFTKLNQKIKGWINYHKVGMMKGFIKEFGEWLRHKVRVVIIKQWKNIKTIFNNLKKINRLMKNVFCDEDFYKVANSRYGLYRKSGLIVVNYIISPKLLEKKTKERPGLVNPLSYYLGAT